MEAFTIGYFVGAFIGGAMAWYLTRDYYRKEAER